MRLRELAASRMRFGYRRLTLILRREGWRVNPKRIYRLYTEDGLTVRTDDARSQARLQNAFGEDAPSHMLTNCLFSLSSRTWTVHAVHVYGCDWGFHHEVHSRTDLSECGIEMVQPTSIGYRGRNDSTDSLCFFAAPF
jgi:transposase InsO family protein